VIVMEVLFAIAIVTLACAGLATGLLLRGRPPQTACEGVDCVGGGRCDVCPRRLAAETSDE